MTSPVLQRQGRLRTRVAVFVCLALVLIAIDQVTKHFAVALLSDGSRQVIVPKFLALRLLYNPGATLGMGSGSTWIIALAAAAACIVIVVLLFTTKSMKWTVGLSVAFAGAAGNLIDRIANSDGMTGVAGAAGAADFRSYLNGAVTDFLDYGWSVGNIADVFLAIAAVIIVILVFTAEPFGKVTVLSTDMVAETVLSEDMLPQGDPSVEGSAAADASLAAAPTDAVSRSGERDEGTPNSHE